MKIFNYIFGSILFCLTFSSCCEDYVPKEIAEECPMIAGAEIFNTKSVDLCFFSYVYRYKGKIYTVCNCCICDKAGIPSDCDGNLLCEISEPCPELQEFNAEAEFLFTISDE